MAGDAETVPLKEFVLSLRDADQLALKAALVANEKRLDAMNEFRASLSDQARTLMPRAECEALMRVMDARIDKLATAADESRGTRSGLSVGWGAALGLFGAVGLAISIYMAFKK